MSDHAYWALTLVLGLVVAAIAVILLEMLYRQVQRIERGAGLVWTAGKQVARNTSTTWLLGETSNRLTLLTDEAGLHAKLLTSGPPSPPSADPSQGSDR